MKKSEFFILVILLFLQSVELRNDKLDSSYNNFSFRRLRTQGLERVEGSLRQSLGKDVVDEVQQRDGEVFQKVLQSLQMIPNFAEIIGALKVGLGLEFLQERFKEAPLEFAEKLIGIAMVPGGIVEVIAELQKVYPDSFIEEHFGIARLFREPNKFNEFVFEPLELNRRILALKLALGPDYHSRIFAILSQYEVRYWRNFLEVNNKDFYHFTGKVASVLDGEVNYTELIKLFQESSRLFDKIDTQDPGWRLIMTSWNLFFEPFMVDDPPSPEELKMLTDLDFGIGLWRMSGTNDWIIRMGHKGGGVEILIRDEFEWTTWTSVPVEDVKFTDIFITNRPQEEKFAQPDYADFGHVTEFARLRNFILTKAGLTAYSKRGVEKYIPWPKVTLSLYNPR